MSTTTTPGGLRAAKKEQAEARKAAEQEATPAKATPADKAADKPAADTPADKAPAAAKLRWVLHGERDEKGRVAQHAESDAGVYSVSGGPDKWQAVLTPAKGKPTVLATDVSHGKAYYCCAHDFKARQAGPAA